MISLFPSVTETYYQVDIVPWNKPIRWGVFTIKMHNGTDVAEAKINQWVNQESFCPLSCVYLYFKQQ